MVEQGNPRNQVIKPLLFKHKVHMTRPHGMSTQSLQQLSHRPVVGNRVWHRDNGFEPEQTLAVALEDAPAVGPIAIGVLDIVFPTRIRLPDVNLHALDRLALDVLHRAEHQQRLCVFIVRH